MADGASLLILPPVVKSAFVEEFFKAFIFFPFLSFLDKPFFLTLFSFLVLLFQFAFHLLKLMFQIVGECIFQQLPGIWVLFFLSHFLSSVLPVCDDSLSGI
ncbi:hypothetical protein BL07042 [Bacillus licheniformis DSM 13 = ATCC 14580]|uniref:Uncharacterized protein n=1 Tax=Bacillus licheniformis (strain ATCC 14580 / DSM 13 / JCM 2505 / CCUG 7422 / NBRC 12200 / NCIMB 9375 / NCTC 10341 / NRRL NRS-1264 / Gibson 46) TaxID=279010 RepID=Q65HS2_BACLD|nr:hypothetical protein BL07042 [Bacillus licheniformis DSM 13 = ATCC 14580]